jgi:ATP-binding cassette subfamily A (ABC1) protein 5
VILRSIIPIYMVMSLSQFIPPMLMVVVDEKEKKIKESMSMVGLRDSVFWLSWLTVYSASVTICVIIITILTKFIIIRSANFFLLFLLIELGGLSMIMIAFVTTAMFSNAKAAANMSGMVTMFLACTYYIQVFAADSPEWVFWLLALISPSGFAMGIDRLMVFDIDNKPIDLWDAAGSISLAGVLIMLTIGQFCSNQIQLQFSIATF